VGRDLTVGVVGAATAVGEADPQPQIIAYSDIGQLSYSALSRVTDYRHIDDQPVEYLAAQDAAATNPIGESSGMSRRM
jgi:hypothetical protein